MDEATANRLRACARELLDSAPGKDRRERVFHAIAAIAWESDDADKSAFDATPIFHAFSDAMSTLVVASGVKRVDVSVVMMDRTALLYTPKAAKPTLVNLDDDAADRPPHNV